MKCITGRDAAKCVKKKIKKLARETRGSVTVFLTCIMLVMVIFEGTIIDSVKIFSAKQTASDANDLALNSVLASYNKDLKNYYGLFAIDNTTALSATANKYFRGSISAANTSASVAGASTFLQLDGTASSDYVDGSSLANVEVFKTELMEYEKYYAVSTLKYEDYLTQNMDIIQPVTELIKGMLEYDKKLYQIQDMIQKAYNCYMSDENITAENRSQAQSYMNYAMGYADELPALWNNWNENNSASSVPDDIKTYMTARLQEASALMISRTTIQNALNSINRVLDASESSDITSDEITQSLMDASDFVYVFSLCYSDEDYANRDVNVLSTKSSLLQNCNEMNRTYIFSSGSNSNSYPLLSPQNTYLHDLSLDYQDNIQVVDTAISRLEQIGGMFDADYIQELVDSKDERFLIMEYTMEMFLSFNYCEENLTGANLMECSANPFSDREYITFGEDTSGSNVSEMFALAMDYCYMWNMIESLCTNTTKDTVAYENAKKLTVVENLATPLAEDVFLIGYALEKTQSDLDGDSVDAPIGMSLYRGDGTYMWMDYGDYSRFGIIMTIKNQGEDIVLQRVQNVIEMNMAYLGHTGFSFDNAYTMASVTANVTVDTSFMRNISFTCTDFGGY